MTTPCFQLLNIPYQWQTLDVWGYYVHVMAHFVLWQMTAYSTNKHQMCKIFRAAARYSFLMSYHYTLISATNAAQI